MWDEKKMKKYGLTMNKLKIMYVKIISIDDYAHSDI